MSAPLLTAMRANAKRLEQARKVQYKLLRNALEEADGVVGRAGAALWPDLTLRQARNRANRLVRKFELVGYATELRIATTGHAFGRQDQ